LAAAELGAAQCLVWEDAMIVQSVADGQENGPHFVVKLAEHLELVGQFGENFGNSEFAPPQPRDEFLYAVRWHDKGWQDLDDSPPLDPKTGLPYNPVETPIPVILITSSRSPEHNEAYHPYCGLIDSMHIWGLYNGRYGLSDKVLIDLIPEEHRLAAETMLNTEYQRQQRLTAILSANAETAPWVEQGRLFTNYKLLQFFDTLALYFNCTHEGGRAPESFQNVPRDVGDDVEIRLQPEGDGTYCLSPYPFREDGLEVYFEGRYLARFSPDDEPDMEKVMRATPLERQTMRLIAG
jgi:hypothetical protein